MKSLTYIIAVSCGIAMPVSVASACSEVFFPDAKRTVSKPDCSFHYGGDNHSFSGDPAKDLGLRKTTQKIVSSPSCPYQEHILVADCETGRTTVVDGVLDPVIAQEIIRTGVSLIGGDYKIEYLFPPHGTVELTQNSHVGSLEGTLDAAGMSTTKNLGERIASFKRKNRFDMMCGCKLFYPELMEKSE